jgi:hypothetical protein
MAESVLRLHRSVYLVFFIVRLPQQRPSRRDDDQPSTELHRRQRNPEERQKVSPNKYDPTSRAKLFMAIRHDNAFRASDAYSPVSARKRLPPSGSTMGKSAFRTRSKLFAASSIAPVATSPKISSCNTSSFVRKRDFTFWPYDGQDQRHSNSNRHLSETMNRDLPCRTRPRQQHHDRQRNAAKTIGCLIRPQDTANQPQKENATCEYERVRLGIARRYRPNQRAQSSSDKTLPRNRERRAE